MSQPQNPSHHSTEISPSVVPAAGETAARVGASAVSAANVVAHTVGGAADTARGAFDAGRVGVAGLLVLPVVTPRAYLDLDSRDVDALHERRATEVGAAS